MKYFLFLAIAFAAGVQRSIEQKCHLIEFQECLFMYGKFAKEHETPFPVNEEEMIQQCLYLDEVQNCAYNYSIQCMSQLERSLTNYLFSSTAVKMRDFCNPNNDHYKNFLKNAKCINDNYSGVSDCAKKGLAAIEHVFVRNKIKPEGRVHFLCCALDKLHTCLNEYFDKTCGREVGPIIGEVIDFLLSDVVIETCKGYKLVSEKCPKLPTIDELDGTYNQTLIGAVLGEFVKRLI